MHQYSLCIYEDAACRNFSPLTLMRPVFDLKCGMFSLREKLIRHFPGARVHYFVRNEFQDLLREERPESVVNQLLEEGGYYINGRFLLYERVPRDLDVSTAFTSDGTIIGAYLSADDAKLVKPGAAGLLTREGLEKLPTLPLEGKLLDFCWDIVNENSAEIARDFAFVRAGGQNLAKIYPSVTLVAQERIHLSLGATVKPGVVIDGESGPVYISEGVEIMANSVVEGPAFIGRGTTIKMGAKIYGGTSIGDVCKIGGEIEGSIVHGYSNKPHEGFLGHSYLGAWVNLGADTNNSDLKNNYGSVSILVDGEMRDSGQTFAGMYVGDHAKSGINTMFNTGTVVGVMANVFGGGYQPKAIPSFSWGTGAGATLYDIEKALETARRVMQRRQKTLTPPQETLLRRLHAEQEGAAAAG